MATRVKEAPATQEKAKPKSRYLTGDPEQERRLREGFIVGNKTGDYHPGATLLTRNHDIIKSWAEKRGASPATVPGTEHDGHLGVLRFNFPGFGGNRLQAVTWANWFKAFDKRHLAFIYQDTKTDGTMSNFFRFDSPVREDA
jgi:hypothetical protein